MTKETLLCQVTGAPELTPLHITGYRLGVAAEKLGLSRRGLRRALARCAARTVAVGRVTIVPPEELERLAREMGRARFRPGPRSRDPATNQFVKGANE